MPPSFQGRNRSAISEYLRVVKDAYPHSYVWLGATDAKGLMVAATDPTSLGRDWKNSAWFQAVRNKGTIYIGDVETFNKNGEGNGADIVLGSDHRSTGKFPWRSHVAGWHPGNLEILTRTVRSNQAERGFSETIQYQFLTNEGYPFVDSSWGVRQGESETPRPAFRVADRLGQPGYSRTTCAGTFRW